MSIYLTGPDQAASNHMRDRIESGLSDTPQRIIEHFNLIGNILPGFVAVFV